MLGGDTLTFMYVDWTREPVEDLVERLLLSADKTMEEVVVTAVPVVKMVVVDVEFKLSSTIVGKSLASILKL